MKNVIITIIMFAITIALLVGVIMPIVRRSYNTGDTSNTSQVSIDSQITGILSSPVE